MTSRLPRELPPLDGFLTIRPETETPDRAGHFVIERVDSLGRQINVDASIGWRRPDGPRRIRREPNTLFIENVQVTERQHLGAAALYLAIQHAKQAAATRGVELRAGRMQIINPSMIWATEKLKDMGLIQDAYYLKNGNTAPHRLPATEGFEDLPGLISAAEAARYMQLQADMESAGVEPEGLGAVCCKFTFQQDPTNIDI